jgi:predicted RNase H-like nuclease
MSALLPKLLPSTKKTRLPFRNTASECGGATGTRTPDPLLAKTFPRLDTQGHTSTFRRPNAFSTQMFWTAEVSRGLLVAPEIAPGRGVR